MLVGVSVPCDLTAFPGLSISVFNLFMEGREKTEWAWSEARLRWNENV
jgi:hypothetical protein